MKSILVLLSALSLLPSAFSAPVPAPHHANIQQSREVYHAGDFTLSPIAISRTADFSKFENGLGLRADWDVTPSVGLTLEATGTDTLGSFVENGLLGLRLGRPLGSVRPYVIVGALHNFERDEFGAAAGLGVEKRAGWITLGLEARAEQYRNGGVIGAGLFKAGLNF